MRDKPSFGASPRDHSLAPLRRLARTLATAQKDSSSLGRTSQILHTKRCFQLYGGPDPPVDILRGAGGARIPPIAKRVGLGLRQFERKFVQQVGLSPKLFSRIARFEAALDRMGRSPQGSWTEVAHRFGYFDQMHLVHDFSRFTGETPTRTLHRFEVFFERQTIAIRSRHAPPSEGGR
jgi:AraC-like DNA-binding protein